MRSASELAQDSVLSSASSFNPAIRVFRHSPRITRKSVCVEFDLIVDRIEARALLARVVGGSGSERALLLGGTSDVRGADGNARVAAQHPNVVDTAAVCRGGECWTSAGAWFMDAAGRRMRSGHHDVTCRRPLDMGTAWPLFSYRKNMKCEAAADNKPTLECRPTLMRAGKVIMRCAEASGLANDVFDMNRDQRNRRRERRAQMRLPEDAIDIASSVSDAAHTDCATPHVPRLLRHTLARAASGRHARSHSR